MDKELYNICIELNIRIDCFKELTTFNKSYNYEGKISKLHLLGIIQICDIYTTGIEV